MEKLDILVSAEFLLTLEDQNILTDAAVGIKGILLFLWEKRSGF